MLPPNSFSPCSVRSLSFHTHGYFTACSCTLCQRLVWRRTHIYASGTVLAVKSEWADLGKGRLSARRPERKHLPPPVVGGKQCCRQGKQTAQEAAVLPPSPSLPPRWRIEAQVLLWIPTGGGIQTEPVVRRHSRGSPFSRQL